MSISTGLFVGAGFSKWAANLPLVSELFDFQVNAWPREAKRIKRVQAAWDRWLASSGSTNSEMFFDYILGIADPRLRSDVIWYIGRRISDPFIFYEWHAGRQRRHVYMIDENRRFTNPGITKASSYLNSIQPGAGIITTNYDLLPEYALGTKRFNYGTRHENLIGLGAYPLSSWLHPVSLSGGLPIAKLHGSLSWDSSGRFTDGRRGLVGESLIVPPIAGKKMNPLLSEAWVTGGQILAHSEELLVFGFAFNEYDSTILNFLAKKGKNIKRVRLIDPYPKLSSAQSIWPNADISCEPVPS
jgi:hypothetical protein